MLDLRGEAADAAAIAVNEKDRFPFAVGLVIEFRAIMLKRPAGGSVVAIADSGGWGGGDRRARALPQQQ